MTEEFTARPHLPLPVSNVANSQEVPTYGPISKKTSSRWTDDEFIEEAINILRARLRVPGAHLADPKAVKQFLTLNLAEEQREVFAVIWLDAQNRVIGFEKLFYGTINQTLVAPREILKAAMKANAAAVVFCHNHPSGVCLPSVADTVLTDSLARVMGMVDVRALDHIIVAGAETYSFAEHGKI